VVSFNSLGALTMTIVTVVSAWTIVPAAIFALIGWLTPEPPIDPEEWEEQANFLRRWRLQHGLS
jgi:hypothetical protein